MNLRFDERFVKKELSFDMTPVIDIVFLLIIFFVVVFQFIGSDDSVVNLPDNCDFAQTLDENKSWPASITITSMGTGKIKISVAGQIIDTEDKTELAGQMQKSLDVQLAKLPAGQRIALLRIDKDVSYSDAQYALAAAAASKADKLQLATLAKKD